MKDIENIRENTRKLIQYLGYTNNVFAHIGSISQCYALQQLEKQDLTILELSQALALEHSSVSRMAKELVAKGFCKYKENTKDKRSRYLLLTKLGKSKLQEIHLTATRQVKAALDTLTESQRKTVVNGINLYAQALEKNYLNNEVSS